MRSFKPLKLTQAGTEVLEKSRTILASVEGLKASLSGRSAATGASRLGISHSQAGPEMSKVIIKLGEEFPLVQPNICSDVSPRLLERLHTGDLDMPIVLLPVATVLPHGLSAVTLFHESFRFVQARVGRRRNCSKLSDLHRRSWVLSPPGCLIREEVRARMEKLGGSLRIAAELHNPDLQLALISGNVGVGMVQQSLLRRHSLRAHLSVIDDADFIISARIACVRGSHLGSREQVAVELERILLTNFQKAGGQSEDR